MIKKNSFAQILVPIVIIVLGTLGYITYKNYAQPLASPIQTQKVYTTKGYATKIDFPKLTFNYPSDWVVNEDASPGDENGIRDNAVVAKEKYGVSIRQELIAGASWCRFKDSPKPIGPYADLTSVRYTEIDSAFGKLRYFLSPLNEDKTKNIYVFCEQEGNEYIFPRVGSISIDTPVNQDEAIFQEALTIVKSIKSLNN